MEKLKNFLEFLTKVQDSVFEENFEYSDKVVNEVTGEKGTTLGQESRLSTSFLMVKYNVHFQLGIFNWFLIAYNLSILKEMALLLYAMVTGCPFAIDFFLNTAYRAF